MKKRILTLALSAAAITTLASSALADYAVYQDTNHLYMGVGVNAYHYSLAEFDLGQKAAGGSLFSGKPSALAIMPTLNIGMHFNNYFLSSLFGPKANLEFDASYFTHTFKSDSDQTVAGTLTQVDGKYDIISQQEIPNFNFGKFIYQNKSTFQNYGLYFKGAKYSPNQAISNSPLFGFVYTTQDQNGYADATINELENSKTTPYIPVQTNFGLNSQYMGAAIGDQINLQINQHVFFNLSGQVQLLHASEKFNENQNYATPNGSGSSTTYNAAANGSLSKISYRALANVGMKLNLSIKPDSPSLDVNAGYDRLGSTPYIVNPTSTGKAATLSSQASNNFYGGVNVHLPF